jgi:hypothetical protein
MEQYFRRQQLHDLVWLEPLTLLAQRFGMSDVALAKICKRHGIPLPGRGHWAKLKAGKTSSRSPLPARALGAEETISIGHSDWNKREEEDRALMVADIPPPPDFTEPLVDLVTRITKLVGHVPPSRNLKSPHRAIAKLLADDAERLEKCRQSPYSYLSDQPFYAAPYEQRRLKLVDAIFKAAVRAGTAPSVPRHRNPGEFTVRVCDSRVRFTLGKPDEERLSWRVTSDIRRPASEPMQLKIDWWSEKREGLILEWTDKPDTPLETLLPQIIVHLIAAAEMQMRICEHQWYERLNQRKAELIEAERQRQEEAVRKERERQRRLERARIDKLLHEAMSLRLADDIRRYVAAVNASNAESPTPLPDAQMVDWSHWALEQAERIDPVETLAFLQPVPEEKNDEPGTAPRGHNPTSPPDPVVPSPEWHPNRWYTRLPR